MFGPDVVLVILILVAQMVRKHDPDLGSSNGTETVMIHLSNHVSSDTTRHTLGWAFVRMEESEQLTGHRGHRGAL